MPQEPGTALEAAIELAQSLYEDLSDHMDLEDELLVPVLRERDSWGPVRADRLQEHHESQRQQLKALTLDQTVGQSPDVLAKQLLSLIEELRTDMEYEERELLSRSAVDDDLVSTDGEDG